MIKTKKELLEGFNFSVVLPGGCNASCDFCFWERSLTESPQYVNFLGWYLKELKNEVTQVSITGGEPTLSPVFNNVIKVLGRAKIPKVVLTSNGANLKNKLEKINGVVKHINISRHDVDDEVNRKVFKSDKIPTEKELIGICEIANSMKIDITINKVVGADYSDENELFNYIEFVKRIGASALVIRKDYSIDTLEQIPLAQSFKSVFIRQSCPVCITDSYLFKGLPVHIKYSLKEPSFAVDGLYELIYHSDGKLTEDWGGLKEVEFVKSIEQSTYLPECEASIKWGLAVGC